MHKFINFHNKRISVTSYRYTDHKMTTLDDLVSCAVDGSDDYLTASFDADELCKHPCACDFLTKYGVTCGNRRGGEVVVLDWDSFVLYADNTVMVDNA